MSGDNIGNAPMPEEEDVCSPRSCVASFLVRSFMLELHASQSWSDGERLYIWRNDGEGGAFSLEEFEKVVEKFYDEHF